MRPLIFALFLASFSAFAADKFQIHNPQTYIGMCDASAAVAVSSNLFVVVSDEDNILRLYNTDKPGPPVQQFDFNKFIDPSGEVAEADLEGAARVGNRAYWIGSHGLNKSGKLRPIRQCFFATDLATNNNAVALTAVGKPCFRLLNDLIADSRFNQFHLKQAATRAPKESDALNIEGLSATPEGHLLIGFRNPVPAGKTLLIPLLNPDPVIQGAPAQFGDPIQLDLGGLGIRDIALFGQTYVIIAGPYHGGSNFRLYFWQGPGHNPERLKIDGLNEFHSEGLVIYPQHGLDYFQVISDDGTREIDGCPCKKLTDHTKQAFRSFWVGR